MSSPSTWNISGFFIDKNLLQIADEENQAER